jgi:hypothetical protein
MSISSAGDVNGDGLDDLIISVNDDSNKEGKAYVVFGKQDGTAIDLSAIAAGIGSIGITMSIDIISNTAFSFSDACRLDKV